MQKSCHGFKNNIEASTKSYYSVNSKASAFCPHNEIDVYSRRARSLSAWVAWLFQKCSYELADLLVGTRIIIALLKPWVRSGQQYWRTAVVTPMKKFPNHLYCLSDFRPICLWLQFSLESRKKLPFLGGLVRTNICLVKCWSWRTIVFSDQLAVVLAHSLSGLLDVTLNPWCWQQLLCEVLAILVDFYTAYYVMSTIPL